MSSQPLPNVTPISLLCTSFSKPGQPALRIDGCENIDMKTQIQCLQPMKCDTIAHRNDVLRELNIADLEHNASKRIRFKSILYEYHKHWRLIHLDHFRPLQDWDHRDFAVNAIVFFMMKSIEVEAASADSTSADASKMQKNLKAFWPFLDYLLQFFRQSKFDGREFINMDKQVTANASGGGAKGVQRGLGFTLTKRMLATFDLKGGPYTYPRKQMTSWATRNVDRYKRERVFNLDEYFLQQQQQKHVVAAAAVKEPQANSASVDSVPVAPKHVAENNQSNSMHGSVSAPAAAANGNASGERWYWFDQDVITWVPYRDEQQKLIEEAWKKSESGATIMVGATKFKVDFNRQDPNTGPVQYNAELSQAWRRQVIRGKPDSNNLLNDFQCSEHPK